MYKIIGSNQSEYGPVSEETIRQWITEGRVNAQTSCKAEGDLDWKPIGSVPAFAALFSPAPSVPPPIAGTPVPPPPLGAAMFGDARGRALQEVNGPAVGLIVTGALGIVSAVSSAVLNTIMPNFNPFQNGHDANLPPQAEQFQHFLEQFQRMAAGAHQVGSVIYIALSIFIIMGALKMKRLENHGIAIGAAIVALIPCVSPCCLLGLPIGIWALVVLNRPDIRSQFS